jgi:hypothetical protein
MTKRAIVAGFALGAAVALASFTLEAGQPLRPSTAAPDRFPAALRSQPPDQEAERIERLSKSLEQTRAAAERNPLLLADVAYYQAELGASRQRMRSLAER